MDPMLHSFGGHALDRYIFDFEPSDGPDGAPDAAAAPSTDPAAGLAPGAAVEPVPPAGATDAAAAFTPEQITALRENPEFQEMFAAEAATIAEARYAALEQARSQQQPLQQMGPQFDVNAFLDPMGENFGANLLQVLGMFNQGVNQTVSGALAPFQQQQEAAQRAGEEANLKTMIGTAAGAVGLKGGDAAIDRVKFAAEQIFQSETLPVYGNTPRAAQVAIDKAVRAEHAYQASVAGTSAVETAQHLATVNGAPAVMQGGSAPAGVTALNGDVLRGPQLVQKYGAIAAAISSR